MRRRALVASMLCVTALSACDGGGGSGGCPVGMICLDGTLPDGGDGGDPPGRDAGDSGRADAGRCALVAGRTSGAACVRDNCTDPLSCQSEIAGMFAMTVNPDGTPAGQPLRVTGFPGSMCALICDPDEPEGTPRNNCDRACTRCNGAILAGRVRFGISAEVPGTCRPTCNATTNSTGGCRDGYACDPMTRTCMERCLDDTQCRFRIGDPDNDGDGDVVYDMGLMARCDSATGRCYVEGRDGATAGDPCREDTDCEDNGLCLQDDEAIPRGYCTRLFCDDDDLPCQPGDVCYGRPFFGGIDRVCLDGCRVGRELMAPDPARAILGTMGGNPDCNPGEMCLWDGIHEATDNPNGGCFLGNYNTETTYDVGTACLQDEDCYSPFGYGRCLFTGATDRVQSGICAIGGCAGGGMGMPISLLAGNMSTVMLPAEWQDDVCNVAAGDLCVNFGGRDGPPTTFCVHSCRAADECPEGYACPELLGGGGRLCWPFCTENSDCRPGTTCRDERGGACDPMTETCVCSDARPAPDAGAPRDAAVGDAGPSDTDAGSDAGGGEADAGTDAGP